MSTFDKGAYTSDIRIVCYKLISRGVGSKNVSVIIHLVSKGVAGLDINFSIFHECDKKLLLCKFMFLGEIDNLFPKNKIHCVQKIKVNYCHCIYVRFPRRRRRPHAATPA